MRLKPYSSKNVVMIISSAAAALAVGGAALLFFAMTKDFDVSIMHFEYGSAFAASALAICLAGIALAAAGFFASTNRLIYDIGNKFSSATVFISTLAGLTCLLYAFVGIRGGLPETKKVVFIAEIVLSVLSAAFFLMKAAGVFEKKASLSLLGLLPSLMCAFSLLRVYFNSEEPLNSPLKIYQIVMLVAFMLYFTAETGVSIQRPKMSRKFTFASVAAISVGGMVSLSRIAARVADVDSFGNFNMVIETFRLILWLYVVVTFTIKLMNASENSGSYALTDSEGAEEKVSPDAASEEDDALLDGIAAKLGAIEGKDVPSDGEPAKDEPEEEEPEEEKSEDGSEADAEDTPGEEAPEIVSEEEAEPEEIREEEAPEEVSDDEEVPEEASEPEPEEPEEAAESIVIPDDAPLGDKAEDDVDNPFTYNGGTADDSGRKEEE